MAATEPRVDNWAADHKRKGTALKKNTRRSADEQFSQVNEQFDQYYRSQLGPLLEEGEWERMEAVMRTALPVTFRLSGPADDAEAHALRDEMEARLVAPLLKHASDALQPPHPLPWYPQRLAWQFDVSRAALRGKGDQSSASGDLKNLHSWLLQETDLGRVQRQEAASMVPPLLLDVRPGHSVLDTCASPGSKTQQIIEILHGAAQAGGADADGRGLVVANDADNKRCHLLVSRASRLRSPRLVVCNHDARLLPEHLGTQGALAAAEDTAAAGQAEPASWLSSLLEIFGNLFCIPACGTAAPVTPLRFDRVLCDVPCSGDGTIRKMPAIWRRWSVGGGNALHGLQLQVPSPTPYPLTLALALPLTTH